MKAKPNIENFLAGGAAAAAEKSANPVPTPAAISESRRTKTIRLSPSLDVFLKEEAFRRTMASGKRVNESDLIEEALNGHFKVTLK
jgi:hypothetical protein